MNARIRADFSQRREEIAAVLDHLQSIRRELNQRQAAVMMLNAERRLRRGSRVRNLKWRPFDLAGGGARGNQPVISGVIIAGGEVNLNPPFERNPAIVRRRYFDFDLSRAVPTPQLWMLCLINTSGGGFERDHARGRVYFINLDQWARLYQPRQYLQFDAVINDLDQLAVGEAKHIVGA